MKCLFTIGLRRLRKQLRHFATVTALLPPVRFIHAAGSGFTALEGDAGASRHRDGGLVSEASSSKLSLMARARVDPRSGKSEKNEGQRAGAEQPGVAGELTLGWLDDGRCAKEIDTLAKLVQEKEEGVVVKGDLGRVFDAPGRAPCLRCTQTWPPGGFSPWGALRAFAALRPGHPRRFHPGALPGPSLRSDPATQFALRFLPVLRSRRVNTRSWFRCSARAKNQTAGPLVYLVT
jgi:hypothetical protein